jgi:hypothetical protein
MNLDKIYKDWNWKKDNLKLNNFSLQIIIVKMCIIKIDKYMPTQQVKVYWKGHGVQDNLNCWKSVWLWRQIGQMKKNTTYNLCSLWPQALSLVCSYIILRAGMTWEKSNR